MPNRDRAALLDIAHAIGLVQQFKRGLSVADFLEDARTQSAVLHQLLAVVPYRHKGVVGEAVKRLSDSFRRDHPEIPWRLIAGMRDLLIHHYDTADLEEVWRVADRDMPDVAQQVQSIIRGEAFGERD